MAAALTISGKGFNPFGRAWAAYERSLRKHPVMTQAATSALLWGLGDGMAQRIENRGRGGIDARRVALTAAFGGAVIGPAGHGWYLMLERLVMQLGLACSLKSMLLKVTADNLLYSPCYVLAFFAYGCMAIDGLSPAIFIEKMREEFMPTMLAEALLWPPYMAFVFSRVPVKHQLLAVNVATLFDVCFLSWVRGKDADRKEEKAKEEAEAAETVFQQQQLQLQPAAAAAAQRVQTLRQREDQQTEERRGRARKVAPKDSQAMLNQQQEQTQLAFAADRELSELAARDLGLAAAAAALWPWDAAMDENLNRLALAAASATCSSASHGGLFGLRLASGGGDDGGGRGGGGGGAPPGATNAPTAIAAK
ncbi:hypothetical protein Vafri_13958 [Volvox africanus]|uniref:Uncharacterized protein n=1 Tax=Volvox africanus TaxID=51714 RepID=A0A8J4BCY2_9CHLO|nr:hypothetical protein Vafri_13958 [Volvox africanus]